MPGGPFEGPLGCLGTSGGSLGILRGLLGVSWGTLVVSREPCGVSWGFFVVSWGPLGVSWGVLVVSRGSLGDLLWSPCGLLGAFWGAFVIFLGPKEPPGDPQEAILVWFLLFKTSFFFLELFISQSVF